MTSTQALHCALYTHHELVAPSGVLVHPHTGHILTDTNHAVLEFGAVSGNLIGTFASHRSLNYPSALTWNARTKDLLVVNRGSGQNIVSFDGTDGTFETIFIPMRSGELLGPSDVLYVGVPEPGGAFLVACLLCCYAAHKRHRVCKQLVNSRVQL
jgi:hypothetical protein